MSARSGAGPDADGGEALTESREKPEMPFRETVQAVSERRKSHKFCILVLEDDRDTAEVFSQAIHHELLNSLVLTARTLSEARLLLANYQVNFFVLDIQLPDGTGIDFLHDILVRQPDAGVAIVTGTPLPEYRCQAEAFGVLHFMEKPVHLPALISLLLTHRDRIQRTEQAPSPLGDTGLFSASLTKLSTLDIIQLKCLAHATVVLDFIARSPAFGRLYFKDGDIIHAETHTQEGVEAFNEIVSWKGGQVVEVTDAPEPTRTIFSDWQNLLLHAVQWSDEQKESKPAPPKSS
jgi:DNA-binding response OmpR family regulator